MSKDQVNGEIEMLRTYALRWAVLAAWKGDLAKRGITTSADLDTKLQRSRVKISSGCFSSCEVSCDLSAVESQLTSSDGSTSDPKVDSWLELLGRAMTDPETSADVLNIPAVKFHYTSCNVRGCSCEN